MAWWNRKSKQDQPGDGDDAVGPADDASSDEAGDAKAGTSSTDSGPDETSKDAGNTTGGGSSKTGKSTNSKSANNKATTNNTKHEDKDSAGATDDTASAHDENSAEAIEIAQLVDLRDRLLESLRGTHLGDRISVVNERTTLRSRFDPRTRGMHDGLAGHPDTSGTIPGAIRVIEAEAYQREKSIAHLKTEIDVELAFLEKSRSAAIEEAAHLLDESMVRYADEHPTSSRVSMFRTPEAAAAAADDALRRANEAYQDRQRADAEKSTATSDVLDDEDNDDESDAAPPPAHRPVVMASDEDRARAAKELTWAVPSMAFWVGAGLLAGAEVPFTIAVVRQLLLEPHPPWWEVGLATIAITVGVFITTKMTGILLRRAQAMFQLASELQPERRPLLIRVTRDFLYAKKSSGRSAPQSSNPTEEALRIGAWTRLLGAVVLMTMLIAFVLSLADYRSDAATALNGVISNNPLPTTTLPVPTTTTPAPTTTLAPGETPTTLSPQQEIDALATQAEKKAADRKLRDEEKKDFEEIRNDAEEDLVRLAFADIGLDTLRNVFLSISLLNVFGSTVLAWASTKVSPSAVGGYDADDPATHQSRISRAVSVVTDPFRKGTKTESAKSKARTRREQEEEKQREEREKQAAEDAATIRRLTADVQARRDDLTTAKDLLAGAIELRAAMPEIIDALTDLSAAQSKLDEKVYWAANRAYRRMVVPPEVDRKIQELRDGQSSSSVYVDTRTGDDRRQQ